MASTGSNRDADIAGIAPEINPIKDDKPNPKNMFPKDRTKEKSSKVALTISEINQTRITPIKPPNKDKIIASNKNWNKMNLFFAPSDFCIPIRLVRSRTLTNIILAIPNPPTSSEKPLITHPMIFRVDIIPSIAS